MGCVAVKTPAHLKGSFSNHYGLDFLGISSVGSLLYDFFAHLVNLAVTLGTLDTRSHVTLVGEVHVIWQVVDLLPRDGFSLVVVLHHLLDDRAVRLHILVTVDASL